MMVRLLFAIASALCLCGGSAATLPAPDLAAFVNPLIGTDGNGNTFSGADVPFGMVQLSPVTVGGGAGGYRYSDQRLSGFAVTRLSGSGCTNYGDLPLLPILAPPAVSPAGNPQQFTAAFGHRDEVAQPGYYQVRLGSGISASLSVTPRTGLAAFSYPATTTSGTLLIQPSAAANARNASIRLVAQDEVVGSATSAAVGGGCGHNRGSYTLYYALVLAQPFRSFGTWTDGNLHAGARNAAGPQVGAYVTFGTRVHEPVVVKVGISFVSVANALLNLTRQGTSWSVDDVRAQARAEWDRWLGRIRVERGSRTNMEIFYTALYHALLHPNIFSDVNGQYIGRDGSVHVARGYTQYTDFSGWDIYRTEIPLLALIAPHETSDMMRSLIADGREVGTLSRWLLANVDTGLMVGDPTDAVIADAYAFGARSFDTALGLREMIAGASAPTGSAGVLSTIPAERPAIGQYSKTGYVDGQAATTLEYSLADFAISQLAWSLGDQIDYQTFAARAGNWRNTFNQQTGFVEPRLANGAYPLDFDPGNRTGFVEGNAYQYSLMVPFDMGDLLAAIGPPADVLQRLDGFFGSLNAGPDVPQAWLGNEPSFGTPYAYLWLGDPARTEEVMRRALRTLFTLRPNGLPGNDDLGALSAWYVWGALGLYPAIPGVAGLTVQRPLFPAVTITFANGRQVKIETNGTGPFIQSLSVNGAAVDSAWLPLAQIGAGARLLFTVGLVPSAWATGARAAPPSFGTGRTDGGSAAVVVGNVTQR
jgi:predicted alpha-1,2-mannosidase